MDADMLARILRQVLQFAAGVLVTRGVIADSTAELAVGAIGAAIVAGYVAYRNTKTARIADVAKLAEVSVVATTPDLAQVIPNPAVVSSEAVRVSGQRVMSHAWPIAALAVALMLGGCNTTSMSSPMARELAMQTALAAARTVAPSTVSDLDRTIAQVAGSPTMASACAVFVVAAGYYDALRPGVSPTSQRMGDATSRAGADLCAHPPADTVQALTTLNRLWAGVQAATKAR